jgi:hypothetical protein
MVSEDRNPIRLAETRHPSPNARKNCTFLISANSFELSSQISAMMSKKEQIVASADAMLS